MRKVMSDFEEKISETEAAKILEIPAYVLRRMRLQGYVEYYRMGKCKPRYSKRVVLELKEKMRVEAKYDIAQG